MKIFIGLGNPGEEYANTRHNAGFMFLDYLYGQAKVIKSWKRDKYLLSDISEIELHQPKALAIGQWAFGPDPPLVEAILAKPQTFMNNSGIAVTKYATRYTLHVTQNILIVHDDLDIPLGQFKISFGKGPKQHNGIISIEEHLHTSDFWRVRIGIDNRKAEKIDGQTYVLQNFLETEKQQLLDLLPQIPCIL